MEHADVVIAGGAVMGSSIAWHLARHPGFSGSVRVVEPDPSYARAASALSAGSIRQQFSTAINIAISAYGIRFLENIGETLAVDGEKPSIGLVRMGYLYCGPEGAGPVYRANNALQRASGAEISLLDPERLVARFPWINPEGVAIASFGERDEGWFDGFGLMQAFRRAARAAGIAYVADRIIGFETTGDRVTAVRLASGERIACGTFVNAAGAAGAAGLAALLGVPLPVRAKKRCVFPFHCRERLSPFPLLIDTSGVWCRPEGEGFIAGYSPDDLDETDHATDFEVDFGLFEDVLWPALAHRVPAFEAIRPGRAWAGHYDMNLADHNALVGPLAGFSNAFLACGFSGHGLQQSPAVGRGLAERIVEGRYTSLDLAPLGMERLTSGALLLERNVI